MYLLYKTMKDGPDKVEFKKESEISLVGNTRGIVVEYLRTIITPKDTEPFEWEIDTKEAVSALGLSGDAVVVDIKPDSKERVMLFELQKIYGLSSYGWTPIMLELRDLVLDKPASRWNKSHFSIPDHSPRRDIGYTFLYLSGTVKDGKPVGTWNVPEPAPTNGSLRRPDTVRYFLSKVRCTQILPGIGCKDSLLFPLN
jgi:hypothetical protein